MMEGFLQVQVLNYDLGKIAKILLFDPMQSTKILHWS